ncbi:hypothetical protein FACS1894199_18100 [Bacteroidia bacterium]|nr:hypothetical protein FACS1894199_18100 [Bacteroidia bacterium]
MEVRVGLCNWGNKQESLPDGLSVVKKGNCYIAKNKNRIDAIYVESDAHLNIADNVHAVIDKNSEGRIYLGEGSGVTIK